MNLDQFKPLTVYTIYIASTPEKVWAALTSAEFSRKYFSGFAVEMLPKPKLGGSFKEVSGSPFACNDDSSTAVQLIQDILAKNPNLDGIFFAGGWPMFAPEGYIRAVKNKAADIKSGKCVIVSFDTLPSQVKLLKEGYATTLIGQRPLAERIERAAPSKSPLRTFSAASRAAFPAIWLATTAITSWFRMPVPSA